MLQSELIFLVFFEPPLWFFRTGFCLPAEWVEHELVHVWLYMAVYTCTLCSCEHQRRRKESIGRGDHNGVGVTFICTQNGVCVGLGPPSLILYQLTPSPHPQTHTNTAEETDSRPDTFFFAFYSFSSLFDLLCSQDLLHSSGRAFLKLQVESSLVTKAEDESRHVWGVWCVCVFVCVCVRACACRGGAFVSYCVCGVI